MLHILWWPPRLGVGALIDRTSPAYAVEIEERSLRITRGPFHAPYSVLSNVP